MDLDSDADGFDLKVAIRDTSAFNIADFASKYGGTGCTGKNPAAMFIDTDGYVDGFDLVE